MWVLRHGSMPKGGRMTGATTPDGVRRLLGTKLHAPRRHRLVVQRHRLTDRLAGAHRPTLTLVSAPAGFGKTTLLSDWLDIAQGPRSGAAWLSLDGGDNDPARFGAYLVAALKAIVTLDTAEQVAQGGQDAKAIAAALLDDLEAAGTEITLVVDDYHTIDNVEIHETISFLVDRSPPNFHLVIATRADPPLPLARWRASGNLLEVRAADLRFTSEEATAYFHDSMDLPLMPMQVDALEARTEGWIAALQLAALSLQGRDDVDAFIDSFTGDDRFVLDYLAEEVLERQPEQVRRFLLATSVLDRLNGPLCDAVTETSGGKVMLERLDRSNLFLVPLDDRRHWYRYHHLFADVLRVRLLDEDPRLVPQLHRRASDWYAAHTEPAEAIGHAMAGGHVELAAQLIEVAAPAMRQSRQEGTLRRWLEALPDDVYPDRPVLAIALVGARMATGDTTGVDHLLQLVEASLDGTDRSPIVFDHDLFARLRAQVAVQRAGLALLGGDLAGTLAHATRVLDLVEGTDHYRRGSATALLALANWTAGDLDAAARHYTMAIEEFVAADHLADMLGCSLALADIQIVQGKLADATRTFEAGLRWTREHPGLRGAADMHVGLSEVLIELNELDAATDHLDTSNDLGESAGLPQHAYRWRVTMARLRRARGDLDGALRLIDEAAPRYDTDFSPPVRPVAAMRVRVQLARGELDQARRWVAESGLTVDDDLSYVREYEHNTLARVLIARAAAEPHAGGLDDAIRLLDRLLKAAIEGGRTGSVIDTLILQAAAYRAAGATQAAVDALDEALRRSEPEGHIRLFLHAGPGVLALVRSLALQEPSTPHARRVLAAVDEALTANPTANTTAAAPLRASHALDLSPRERDVLRMLRSELSGPDIARELHVSLNTLRSHTKSIFTKLGATNRREALRLAAEHGV